MEFQLPSDIQQKVKTYVNSKRPMGANVPQHRPEPKVIKVPIPTFPPTAMVYSVNKGGKLVIKCDIKICSIVSKE